MTITIMFTTSTGQAGDTPLHRFVRGNLQQAVAALLAHGADPNAPNPTTGDTPLHVAAREKNEEVMALLVSLGAADETAEVRVWSVCAVDRCVGGGCWWWWLLADRFQHTHAQNGEGLKPRDLHALPEG